MGRTKKFYLIAILFITFNNLYSQDNSEPIPKWSVECKGSVFGIITDMPDDETKRSNLFKIELDSAQSNNYHFEFGNFIPGETRTVNWKLTVKNLSQDAKAVIKFTDSAFNDTTITIEWLATNISIEPRFYSFGRVAYNSRPEADFTITNNSTRSTVTFKEGTFLFKNQNFDIIDITYPLMLSPGQSKQFKIRFRATAEGIFRDSAGFSDTCQAYFRTFVEAKVGTPVINTSDIAFGDINSGSFMTEEFYLVNTGTTELVVDGFTGPNLPNVFSIELPRGASEITPQNPLKLGLTERDTFRVTFTPQSATVYNDTIKFSSDATTIDNIAVLSGRGIKSDMTVTSVYDWGRLMIDRALFPRGPYPPENGAIVIRLINNGTKDIKITKLDSSSSDKSYAFEFDRAAFTNLIIKEGDTVDIPVLFHPDIPGEYSLELNYENTAGLLLKTQLKGTGTVPRISTEDYDFGSTAILDAVNPRTKMVRFTNIDWEYTDTLTIFDFEVKPTGNEISQDISYFGTQGFRYDKKKLGLPDDSIVLAPGEYIEFPAQFVAQFSGFHTAKLKSRSNALMDTVSVWNGRSAEAILLDFTGDSSEICSSENDTLICVLTNLGTKAVNIASLKLQPTVPEFDIIDKTLVSGFVLAGSSPQEIRVLFNPGNQSGQFNSNIVAKYEPQDDSIQAQIRSNSINYQITTSGWVNNNKIGIDDTLQYKLILDGGDDITKLKIINFNVDIKYSKNFLYAVPSQIRIGDNFINKFRITGKQFNAIGGIDNKDSITLTIEAIGSEFLSGVGDLIVMKFYSFLPTYSIEDLSNGWKNTKTTIEHTIFLNDDKCLEIELRAADVTLDTLSFCAYNKNKIMLTNTGFDIYTRPSNDGIININFSLGYDAMTDLKLYNTSGILIDNIISKSLKSGKYSINLNTESIPNGIYFITMHSGLFFDICKLIIIR